MNWLGFFKVVSRETESARKHKVALYERAWPILREMEWQPCLHIIDGRTARVGAVVNAERTGQRPSLPLQSQPGRSTTSLSMVISDSQEHLTWAPRSYGRSLRPIRRR